MDRNPWIDTPESTWAPLPDPAFAMAPGGEASGPRDIWSEYESTAQRLTARFEPFHTLHAFNFMQPLPLQKCAPRRLRRPYVTPVAYTDWGPRDAPVVLCLGGVANSAMRFAFLAADLQRAHRVICMDWVGRGRSGWLADDGEYGMDTYVEQVRQLIAHLGVGSVTIVGSSMGGSVGIEVAARHPKLVDRLMLNDIGAYMPRARRQRRSETLARFYVFRTPDDMLRRVGAAQKNDGPVSAPIRLFITYHQTRWSPENGGRIYRADPRAMVAYQREAKHAVDQWAAWQRVTCPVLLMHGMASDALLPSTIARMRRMQPMSIVHVPQTGHTPVLSDRHQTIAIADWLRRDGEECREFSVTLSKPREPWSD